MVESLKLILVLATFGQFASYEAFAQTPPDIQETITLGSQIEDLIEDQQQGIARGSRDDEAIDGEAGVYVLQRNDIFYVSGGLSGGYASNPLNTADDVGGSFLTAIAISSGVQTKIAEKFDFGLSLNATGTQYEKDFGPSSRSLNSAVNIGTAIGGTPIYVGLTGFGGLNFDEDFDQGTSFYGVAASLSAGFPIGKKMIVRSGVGATRQWSEVSENNSTSASTSLEVIRSITSKLSASASARISRTWFDNFFEDATFVVRRDWNYSGTVALSYQLGTNANLGTSFGYEKRSSTFFLSAYDNFDAAVSLSLRLRF